MLTKRVVSIISGCSYYACVCLRVDSSHKLPQKGLKSNFLHGHCLLLSNVQMACELPTLITIEQILLLNYVTST